MIDCSKTENYFIEKLRMTKRTREEGCKIKCSECPLSSQNNGTSDEFMSCITFEMLYPEKAIEIVQKWSDAHPQKTFLTEYLKHYPNAPLGDNGTPIFCPSCLGLMSIDDCRIDHNCVKCWNQPIEESDLVESEKIDIKNNKA